MKKLCLLASILVLALFLGKHLIDSQTPTFLAVPYLTAQEAAAKTETLTEAEAQGIARLVRFEDTALLYDATTNHYFITVGTTLSGNFNTNAGIALYWLGDTNEDTIAEVIANNETLSLLAIYNGSYEIISLSISTLPLVSFNWTDTGLPLTAIDPDDAQTNRYTVTTSLTNCFVCGATSAIFPKKPYAVSLIDDDGTREAMSLFGLRSDDDWNFNAVYGDISRIREAATLDLLQQVADTTEETTLHPQSGVFCELFINDVYFGIYQMLEPMDTQQTAIDEDTDYLYKVRQYFTFDETFYTLNENTEESENALVAKSYPADAYDTRYDVLADYLAFLEGEALGGVYLQTGSLAEIATVIDIDNLIDISIANTVLSLWDNAGKNAMIVFTEQEDGSYLMHREYFDFNYSLGDAPSYIDGVHAYTAAINATLISTDDLFLALQGTDCFAEFLVLYKERYAELREGVFSEENMLSTVALYYDSINESGAYARDTAQWGIPGDSTEDYERLVAYISEHLLAVDEYVETLS